MTMQEASLRTFCHDALFAHHDRDVRTFAAFQLDILTDVELRVWLAEPWQKLRELVFQAPTTKIVHGKIRSARALGSQPWMQ